MTSRPVKSSGAYRERRKGTGQGGGREADGGQEEEPNRSAEGWIRWTARGKRDLEYRRAETLGRERPH